MARREGEFLRRGIVALDEGCTGGKCSRPARRGRRQPGKTLVAIAIDRWLPWSQVVLSNCRRWTLHSLHGVSPGHLQAYPGECCYRFNRREQRADLLRRVLERGDLSADPAPSSLLTAT